MNQFELSAILFYADFLSMQNTSTAVTDSCKYFYIYNIPMNICFIAGVQPQYDINNKYFKQAYNEYSLIKDRFGEGAVESFLDSICNLKATGSVSGEQMLMYIHRFDTKKERERAYKIYSQSKKNQVYTHIINGVDGAEEQKCTKYVAHAEQSQGISSKQTMA